MTKPKPRELPPIVSEIGQRAQIRALNLVRCSCEVVGALSSGQRIEDLQFGLRGGAERHKTDAQVIACGFGVTLSAVGPKPDAILVAKISCDYAVQYHFEDKKFLDGLKVEELHMFSAYNTSFHVWPHVREFVQSMAFRMAITPIVLPVFRPLEMIGSPESWQPRRPVGGTPGTKKN